MTHLWQDFFIRNKLFVLSMHSVLKYLESEGGKESLKTEDNKSSWCHFVLFNDVFNHLFHYQDKTFACSEVNHIFYCFSVLNMTCEKNPVNERTCDEKLVMLLLGDYL